MSSYSQSQASEEELRKEPTAEVLNLARRLLPAIRKSQRDALSPAGRWTYIKTLADLGNTLFSFITLRRIELDPAEITFLARGGYNDVWLVDYAKHTRFNTAFILRIPTDDSLKPYQVENEVGWLRYLALHCPGVPVPRIYDFNSGAANDEVPFIAEEYVRGRMLCDVWMAYAEEEKETVARKIAALIVEMGQLRFDKIGGMTATGTSGPTVEGHKLFKGRDRFHSPECYDIGPYASTEQYVLAQYDKEIYYHEHADESMLDRDLYDSTSPTAFAQQLRDEQTKAKAELEEDPQDHPFVLCHNDLQGRNILVRGTEIAAVIDWEFAGSYPLSELNDLSIDVMEYENEGDEEENHRWGRRIAKDLVPRAAVERGWSEEDIAMLKSGGRPLIQAVRTEMFPQDDGEDGDGELSQDERAAEGAG